MSKKHLFHSSHDLVVKGLQGLVAWNPKLSLIPTEKVVFDRTHPRDKVAIVSGGGGGHEPAWAGYVGRNMLAASASGDIFASPSSKQISAAIDSVPNEAGTILVITNYTGDCLHFGLAAEKANGRGKKCGMIICGDDVGVGKKGSLVGRRGLAGQIAVLKILGAASAAGASFDECMNLGNAVASQLVSIAVTLDHCHVPGRAEHAMLNDDEIEIGTGPHNEPGYEKISPVPLSEHLLSQLLAYLLDPNDANRAYVPFAPTDATVLMLCNFGGVAPLEIYAAIDEILAQLAGEYNLRPLRVYAAPFETSLNAPAFSVTLLNLTAAATAAGVKVNTLLSYLDLETETAWEAAVGGQRGRVPAPLESQIVAQAAANETNGKHTGVLPAGQDMRVVPAVLEAMLLRACDRVVAAEADLTRWDTEMGDGDCGETFRAGSEAVSAVVGEVVGEGSVVGALGRLSVVVENHMGGTLGGILGILFVALPRCLRETVVARAGRSDAEVLGRSLGKALESLQRYTPAKVGDRTVMDVLIPFAEMLEETGDFTKAVEEAKRGAEATRSMTPRLGRATYVGGMRGMAMPPDPGAWGAMEVIVGLLEGMRKGVNGANGTKRKVRNGVNGVNGHRVNGVNGTK